MKLYVVQASKAPQANNFHINLSENGKKVFPSVQ